MSVFIFTRTTYRLSKTWLKGLSSGFQHLTENLTLPVAGAPADKREFAQLTQKQKELHLLWCVTGKTKQNRTKSEKVWYLNRVSEFSVNFHWFYGDSMLCWTEKPSSSVAGKESADSRRTSAHEFSSCHENRQTDVIIKRQIVLTAQQPGSSAWGVWSSTTSKFWQGLMPDAGSSDKVWSYSGLRRSGSRYCRCQVWKVNYWEARMRREKKLECSQSTVTCSLANSWPIDFRLLCQTRIQANT